jgi:hypothetical protein
MQPQMYFSKQVVLRARSYERLDATDSFKGLEIHWPILWLYKQYIYVYLHVCILQDLGGAYKWSAQALCKQAWEYPACWTDNLILCSICVVFGRGPDKTQECNIKCWYWHVETVFLRFLSYYIFVDLAYSSSRYRNDSCLKRMYTAKVTTWKVCNPRAIRYRFMKKPGALDLALLMLTLFSCFLYSSISIPVLASFVQHAVYNGHQPYALKSLYCIPLHLYVHTKCTLSTAMIFTWITAAICTVYIAMQEKCDVIPADWYTVG